MSEVCTFLLLGSIAISDLLCCLIGSFQLASEDDWVVGVSLAPSMKVRAKGSSDKDANNN